MTLVPDTELTAFLEDPASHGTSGPVRRIDTHAASVFLAAGTAVKLKRAVKFPFLDYSTVDKRKRACERELLVNRANAPMIYRDVVAVTREADGRLAIGGEGEPVDWLVRMNRFDEAATLDHIAARGPLPEGLAEGIAAMLATAHARAREVGDAESRQWIDDLDDYVRQNKAAFLAAPDLFAPEKARMLTAEANAMLSRIQPLLEQRGRIGMVRRGHGDGHLGNIVLIDGVPVLFDAIEFDERVATGDVLYDLAFVLMDLGARGLADDANRVFNHYLASTRRLSDLEDLAALPFYMMMRACIRAKVSAARRDAVTPDERAQAESEARRHFEFSLRYLEPQSPRLAVIAGLSGTGKSTVARAVAPDLAPPPGAVVLRSDVERKLLFEVDASERLPPQAYTAQVTREVYTRLAEKAHLALAAGHSVVVDAVFARGDERATIEAVARRLEIPLHAFWLRADARAMMERVANRTNDASDADVTVVKQQLDYETGDIAWQAIDADGTRAETIAAVHAALETGPTHDRVAARTGEGEVP